MVDTSLLSSLSADSGAGGVPLSALAGMPNESLNQPEAPPNPQDLLNEAKAKYGFIAQHNPIVVSNPGAGEGNYAETWPAGEPGDKQYPRPAGIPLGRHGIEIYRPHEFDSTDLAAELLHVDPHSEQTRNAIIKSMTPEQIKQLANSSKDYQVTTEKDRKLQNGVDAFLRGRVFGQRTSSNFDPTPFQQYYIDALKNYVVKGQ